MRKFLIVALCFISVGSFAQLRLGVKGGFEMAKFFDKGSDQQYFSLSNINTIQAGLIAEKDLSDYFFFQSGLGYIQKGGFKQFTGQANSGTTSTLKLNYIQVPVNIVYKESINKHIKGMVSAGFYAAVGISGTEKGYDQTTTGTNNIDRKVQFSNEAVYVNGATVVKPFDFGYNLSAGIEYKKFQFTLDFSRGFKTIYPFGTTNFANQTLGISVAYLMPWK
jgi:hypothetical protein